MICPWLTPGSVSKSGMNDNCHCNQAQSVWPALVSDHYWCLIGCWYQTWGEVLILCNCFITGHRYIHIAYWSLAMGALKMWQKPHERKYRKCCADYLLKSSIVQSENASKIDLMICILSIHTVNPIELQCENIKFSVYFTSWNEAVTLKLKCIYILSSKKIIKEIQSVLSKIKGIKKWNIHHEFEKKKIWSTLYQTLVTLKH